MLPWSSPCTTSTRSPHSSLTLSPLLHPLHSGHGPGLEPLALHADVPRALLSASSPTPCHSHRPRPHRSPHFPLRIQVPASYGDDRHQQACDMHWVIGSLDGNLDEQ